MGSEGGVESEGRVEGGGGKEPSMNLTRDWEQRRGIICARQDRKLVGVSCTRRNPVGMEGKLGKGEVTIGGAGMLEANVADDDEEEAMEKKWCLL